MCEKLHDRKTQAIQAGHRVYWSWSAIPAVLLLPVRRSSITGVVLRAASVLISTAVAISIEGKPTSIRCRSTTTKTDPSAIFNARHTEATGNFRYKHWRDRVARGWRTKHVRHDRSDVRYISCFDTSKVSTRYQTRRCSPGLPSTPLDTASLRLRYIIAFKIRRRSKGWCRYVRSQHPRCFVQRLKGKTYIQQKRDTRHSSSLLLPDRLPAY